MNADARVTALVQSSCTCWNAASAAPIARARSSPRATPRTLPTAAPAAECASATCPPRRLPELARHLDLVRALLELRTRAGDQIEHRTFLRRVVVPRVAFGALAQPVDPRDEETRVVG